MRRDNIIGKKGRQLFFIFGAFYKQLLLVSTILFFVKAD